MSSDDSRCPLAVSYLLLFAATGITLPFLPAYLTSLGFSSAQLGVLLAVSPALSMVAPPLWGQLADRSGRPGAVLLALTLGGAAGFSLLLFASSFVAALFALAAYAVFASSYTTLLDTLTLNAVVKRGGTYAQVRLFGSLGFILSALAFGFSRTTVDRAAVTMPLLTMVAFAMWTAFTLTRRRQLLDPGHRPSARAAFEIARRPEVLRFLIAVCLHWVACTPYHGTLSLHVNALHLPPRVVSLSAAVGVIAELLLMASWPRWGHRVDPRALLCVSFAASALRWLGMSLTSDEWVLTALAVLHGLTFGAFFVSSVGFMSRQAPDALRATGQALFVASAFGLGGLSGYLLTGLGYDALGGHRLFLVAAGVELIPAALMFPAKNAGAGSTVD